MGCLTAKASGSIANFISPTVTPIESAKVYFSPTQLGEGTPSPENVREIVGRTSVELKQCGKNLFDKSQCVNNYRLKTDGTNYKANDYYISLFIPVKVGNVYVKNSPSIDAYHRFCTYSNADATSFIRKVDNSNSITIASNERYIRFCGKITEKDTAQLELGSTATPYEPYQGKTIPFSWKRLPDEYQEVEYIESNGNGEYIDTGFIGNMGVCVETKFNLLSANGNPAIIGSRIGSNNRFSFPVYYHGFDLAIGGDDSIGTWNLQEIYMASIVTNNNGSRMDIYGDNDYHVYKTVSSKVNNNLPLYIFRYNRDGNPDTINSSALRLYYLKIYDGDISDNLMVRYFIPCYRKSDNEIGMYDTVSQTFYTNQGTGTFTKGNDVFSDEVYGGYVDLVKGEIVETNVYDVLDTVNSEPLNSQYNTSQTVFFRCDTDYVFAINNGYIANLYCENLQPSGKNWGGDSQDSHVNTITRRHGSSQAVCIRMYNSVFDINADDTNEVKKQKINTWLAENPIHISYKLATPITHPLPDYLKTQLQTLKNENTFWSDADSVEIDYGLAETFDIQKAKRKIIMNQPHVETLTGDAISFTTDMKAPLKECKVSFMPVQEGSGDPSPSNVRNITGWSGLNVTRCGKNIAVTQYGYDSYGSTTTATRIVTRITNPNNYVSSLVTIKPNTSYTISRQYCGGMFRYFFFEDYPTADEYIYSIGGNIAASNNNKYNMTFTTPSNAKYLFVVWTRTDASEPCGNVQIEIADTATDYESYQGTVYPIDWTDDAGTVYGGYVDLVSGELVVEYCIVDLGTLTFTKYDNTVDDYLYSATLQLPVKEKAQGEPSNLYCTALTPIENVAVIGTITRIELNTIAQRAANTSRLYVKVNASSATDVKELLTGVLVSYELETPITYQLTPQQLITLKGQNNLWADTNGTTEIKFWKH